jgi:3-methylcrotonyl-CoA carboxylase alpha subunit/acetyl-CoA/propionyl-CoA carboxylase biotin carboxyl carrier protein
LRYERLLVANRGEIAARVLQAARGLGLSTVAVYSEADRDAPYAGLADLSVSIGPSASEQSYLSPAALIAAAKLTSATAIHPGYGFLSESAPFARACVEAGLVFVGPPASVIEKMSRKDEARRIAESAGLRVLPAAEGAHDDELVASVVGKIGFPALIKAVAGGGGKAMHVVADEKELRRALASARREAEAAFGDAAVMVERFVEHGRHVEVQVVADEAGNFVHLFERDCSVQRRHQKVIEEAPAPGIDEAVRDRLCADAVRLARTVGYLSVGTVEFLVAGGETYFLEMNTRLQVEHRVTEAVTGLDLVGLQLEIAQGLPLRFTQADVACAGHAIEVRVYAEDPEAGFLPQAGTPSFVRFSEHALVDASVSEGRAVTTFYDPLLAKIVVAGPSRRAARDRLIRALDESAVFGLKTNLGFCRRLVASQVFAEAAIDVNTLDRGPVPASRVDGFAALAVAASILVGRGSDSPLGAADGWRLGGPSAPVTLQLCGEEGDHVVVVDREVGTVRCGGHNFALEVLERSESRLRCSIDGSIGSFHFVADRASVTIGYRGSTYAFDLWRRAAALAAARPGGDLISAPMPGVVLELEARRGARVREGEVLAVLESMKMEFPLRTPRDGVVAEVCVARGDQVELDAPLVRLEPPEDAGGEPTDRLEEGV